MNKMKKVGKLLSLLLTFVLVLSLLAACGSDDSSTPDTDNDTSVDSDGGSDTSDDNEGTDESETPAEDSVTVKLGIWPEPTLTDDIAVHEGYVYTMEQLHPNVVIEPAYYKYATDTFVSMAESGNLPTIFETWYTEPQKLINGDFVADITDNLESKGWLGAINPSIRDLLSKDGRIYGIPRDGYALGLMCNVELFQEAGLVDDNGIPLFPQTWEELAETAKAIKDATGQPGFVLLAKDNAGGWHFSNIAWAFGADLSIPNDDGTFTSNIDSPEAIAAMEYVKSLKWDYDVLTADPTNEDWGTGFTAIGTSTAAMYIAANDAVNQPTQVNGLPVDLLSMCALPEGPGGQFSLSGGTPYMFSKDATTEEINAALDYLEIMGKAPVASPAAIEGMKADAENKVANGVPVIPRFPTWIDEDVLQAEADIIEEYGNVDPALYDDYFEATQTEGNLRMEEEGSAQDLYAELTKVLQAVVTDKDADVAALMKTADENYQSILDDLYGNN